MPTADLLLHPVRLRIVKAFLGDRALTTSQLAAELHDVPAGSLYRHVARLTKAGVLQIAAERRIRGTLERTYTMRAAAAQIHPAEARAMTPAEHTQAFIAYIASLLADFDRYITTAPPDPATEAGYRAGALWLTDAEQAQLLLDLTTVFAPRLANPPGNNRRRRLFYTTYLPATPQQPPPPPHPS